MKAEKSRLSVYGILALGLLLLNSCASVPVVLQVLSAGEGAAAFLPGSSTSKPKIGQSQELLVENHKIGDNTVKVLSLFITDSERTRLFYKFRAFDKEGKEFKVLMQGNQKELEAYGKMSAQERKKYIGDYFIKRGTDLEVASSPEMTPPPPSASPPAIVSPPALEKE